MAKYSTLGMLATAERDTAEGAVKALPRWSRDYVKP